MPEKSKIYPQVIKGRYRTIKNYCSMALLFVYFACSWLRWDRGEGVSNQALMIDLPARRWYFFSLEIWSEEVYYLTAILILAALGLFLFTSLFGRIWCGYTCPQTVFTEVFVKIETFFQGDRNARIRLDHQPWDRVKLTKKVLTHIAFATVSFGFAFGWVCYFYGAPELTTDLFKWQVSKNALIWLASLSFSTYLFAAIMRDKVCTHMCPYGRFQSAMLDADTKVVTYHDWRGEPRKGSLPEGSTAGDCIDCGKCVVVCPMGIDIRDGLQMSCIGCGLCVDACNSVMEKIDKPLYLISYDSIRSTQLKKAGKAVKLEILRPKIVFYSLASLLAACVLLYSIANKVPYKLSISKDRSALFTYTPEGLIRNTYLIKITNRTVKEKKFSLRIGDKLGAIFLVQNQMASYDREWQVAVPGDSEATYKVFVKARKPSSHSGDGRQEEELSFILTESDSSTVVQTLSTFSY